MQAGQIEGLSEAMAALCGRVQHSLALVQCGRAGVGAAIVWRPDGVLVTNQHVVAAGRPTVVLEDGRSEPAQIVASDRDADLAVLQIGAQQLPALALGDSRRLRVGQLALAVGNPWGQRGVITAGIISGLGPQATGTEPREKVWIRSDVRLAPGNSGGPLVDASGAVIGINTMIVGGDLSVAIPAHIAEALVVETLDRRVMLGVGVRRAPLPAGALTTLGREQESGLLVVELAPRGPAERAGVLVGDILVDLSGSALDRPRALTGALAARHPGDQLALSLLRGGQWHRADVELAPLEQAA